MITIMKSNISIGMWQSRHIYLRLSNRIISDNKSLYISRRLSPSHPFEDKIILGVEFDNRYSNIVSATAVGYNTISYLTLKPL